MSSNLSGNKFFELLHVLPDIKLVDFKEEQLLVEDLSSSGSSPLNRSSESPSGSPMLLRRKSANRLRRSSSPAGSPPTTRGFPALIAYSCTIASEYVVETSGDAVCSSREEAREVAAANFLRRLQRYDNDQMAAANRPEAIELLRQAHGGTRSRGMSAPEVPKLKRSAVAHKKNGIVGRFRSRLRKKASSPRNIPIKN